MKYYRNCVKKSPNKNGTILGDKGQWGDLKSILTELIYRPLVCSLLYL